MVANVDIEAIAAALKASKPVTHDNSSRLHQWEHDVRVIGNAFLQFDEKFNRELFYFDCELGQ